MSPGALLINTITAPDGIHHCTARECSSSATKADRPGCDGLVGVLPMLGIVLVIVAQIESEGRGSIDGRVAETWTDGVKPVF